MPAWLPHDLLWGMSLGALPLDAPAWVVEVIAQGQPVVVRRASMAPGRIAVGVRGPARQQRYATSMREVDISRCIRPEQLTHSRATVAQHQWPALRALEHVRPLLNLLGLPWGVTGSAGFELASAIPALHEGSDLDLILRTPKAISRTWAAQLLTRLESAPCRIDMQLQTPGGAVMLREWGGSARQVLLKSATGAFLVDSPWQTLEALA